jgi:hypothetical protein
MRATVMFVAGDVRIEDVPDASIVERHPWLHLRQRPVAVLVARAQRVGPADGP